MEWLKTTLEIATPGKGMFSITRQVEGILEGWRVTEGICHLFIQHTSASLSIGESYDPTARQDMETFLERLVPPGQAWYRHTLEGEDDSPSHLRALITNTSLSIPVDEGRLSLGRWQGIFVFEHRTRRANRSILVRCLKTI